MLYNRSQLISLLNTKVISGGRSTTAQNVRDFENEMIDSLLNWADDTDTDGTLAANSDTKIATQKAVKTYVNALVSSVTLSNVLSVGNTTGGSDIVVSVGDKIRDASNSVFLDIPSGSFTGTDGASVRQGLYFDLSGGGVEVNAINIGVIQLQKGYFNATNSYAQFGAYDQSTSEVLIKATTTTAAVYSTYGSFAGLEYSADYSANYSNRSLVDKAYVTGGFVPYTGATTRLEMGANDILFDPNYGIDTQSTAGSDVLNIGATNAEVINYGNANTIHNFLGTAIYELQVNSYVTDKLMTLNYGGSVASGIGVGFEIEENSVITGYFKTNAARSGFSILTPAIAYYSDLSLASLTANRTHTLPDATGTIALESYVTSNFLPLTLTGATTVNLGANNLTFDAGANTARIILSATNATDPKIFSFRTSGSQRWAFRVDGVSDDFAIRRYDNTGTFIDAPISIDRTAGTVIFDNAISVYGVTSTGATGTGALVFGTQPTFTQWLTVPRIYGGTGVNDGIDFYSTTGNGTSGSIAHRFRGGNNGAVTILEMYNNGNLRIQNNRTIFGLDSASNERSLFVWSSGDNISIIGRPGTTDINLNPTSGGIGLYVKSNGDGGIGVASPAVRWHVVKTSEQLRVGYSTSDYASFSVASTGILTLSMAGTDPSLKILNNTAHKLSFWNKTPIAQPTTSITGATRVGGAGATITDTDTFGGYTIPQLAAIIINTGLAQ